MNEKRSQTIETLKVIAHQWRQPLNLINMEAINLNVQANLEEQVDAKTIIQSTRRIEEQVQRMSLVLKSILNLGSSESNKRLFSLNKLFNALGQDFRQTSKNKEIDLQVSLVEDDVEVYGFSADLHEVLLNLLNNAADAYKEQNSDNKTIFLEGSCNDKTCIIKVRDNAGGIPESIANKVFEQNFSTKITGEGFGIGLYIAKLLIETEFDGSIKFETTSQGTEFVITLPRKDVCTLKFIY